MRVGKRFDYSHTVLQSVIGCTLEKSHVSVPNIFGLNPTGFDRIPKGRKVDHLLHVT